MFQSVDLLTVFLFTWPCVPMRSTYVALADRLGIMKEMQPLYVATFSEKPAVLEGHPFIVEAGVSLGGAEVSEPSYPASSHDG